MNRRGDNGRWVLKITEDEEGITEDKEWMTEDKEWMTEDKKFMIL